MLHWRPCHSHENPMVLFYYLPCNFGRFKLICYFNTYRVIFTKRGLHFQAIWNRYPGHFPYHYPRPRLVVLSCFFPLCPSSCADMLRSILNHVHWWRASCCVMKMRIHLHPATTDDDRRITSLLQSKGGLYAPFACDYCPHNPCMPEI